MSFVMQWSGLCKHDATQADTDQEESQCCLPQQQRACCSRDGQSVEGAHIDVLGSCNINLQGQLKLSVSQQQSLLVRHRIVPL